MQRAASKSILTRAKRPACKKTVSFCSEDECRVYRADDYDRTAVAPSRDLSTRDYQELEEVLNVTTGRVHMPLLPLLQDDAPRSPPAPSQPPPRFPSAPSRFTSFNFLPVNPNVSADSAHQTPSSPPPPTSRPPTRQFPGFAFVSVVPVTDAAPPSRVPESRPTNFLPLTPVATGPAPSAPSTSSAPASPPAAPLTVTFKRQPQHRTVDSVTRPPISPSGAYMQPSRPNAAAPISIPTSSPGGGSNFRSWSPPSATLRPPSDCHFRPSSSPPYCAPIASAAVPQSPPHTRLRSMAS